MGTLQLEKTKQSPVGWATASTVTSVYSVIASPGKWRLIAAYFTPDVTAAIDATNTATLTVKNGSTTLGTLTNGTVAFTAGVARKFTLAGDTSLEFTEGDEIAFDKAVAASGTAITGEFSYVLEKVQADSF